MVGTGRFELPTPRTPSECSTRLSHVPTRLSRPWDEPAVGSRNKFTPGRAEAAFRSQTACRTRSLGEFPNNHAPVCCRHGRTRATVEWFRLQSSSGCLLRGHCRMATEAGRSRICRPDCCISARDVRSTSDPKATSRTQMSSPRLHRTTRLPRSIRNHFFTASHATRTLPGAGELSEGCDFRSRIRSLYQRSIAA
jgi:hypothetical protein